MIKGWVSLKIALCYENVHDTHHHHWHGDNVEWVKFWYCYILEGDGGQV